MPKILQCQPKFDPSDLKKRFCFQNAAPSFQFDDAKDAPNIAKLDAAGVNADVIMKEATDAAQGKTGEDLHGEVIRYVDNMSHQIDVKILEKRKSQIENNNTAFENKVKGAVGAVKFASEAEMLAARKVVQDTNDKIFSEASAKMDVNLKRNQEAKSKIDAIFAQRKKDEETLRDFAAKTLAQLGEDRDPSEQKEASEKNQAAIDLVSGKITDASQMESILHLNGADTKLSSDDVKRIFMGILSGMPKPEKGNATEKFMEGLPQNPTIQDLQLQTLGYMGINIDAGNRTFARKTAAGALFNEISADPDLDPAFKGKLIAAIANISLKNDLSKTGLKSFELLEIIEKQCQPIREQYERMKSANKAGNLPIDQLKAMGFLKGGEVDDKTALDNAGLFLTALQNAESLKPLLEFEKIYLQKVKDGAMPKNEKIEKWIAALKIDTGKIKTELLDLIEDFTDAEKPKVAAGEPSNKPAGNASVPVETRTPSGGPGAALTQVAGQATPGGAFESAPKAPKKIEVKLKEKPFLGFFDPKTRPEGYKQQKTSEDSVPEEVKAFALKIKNKEVEIKDAPLNQLGYYGVEAKVDDHPQEYAIRLVKPVVDGVIKAMTIEYYEKAPVAGNS